MRIVNFAVVVLICIAIFSNGVSADVTITPNGTGDYPSIQAAIDGVSAGETFWLVEGEYSGPDNKNLTFGGKVITISGIPNNDSSFQRCVSNCENDGLGFVFGNDETTAATIEGFNIKTPSNV